jgi:uncharacterized membrane protein
MEAFSDGVFAIAATLLVLEIALRPPGSALEQVLHAWPGYLGYAVSFLTIGAAWLAHAGLTNRLERVDSLLLRINLLLLLVIAFLPFPTKLMVESLDKVSDERVFVTFYGLTLLAIRLLGSALDGYATREHLYRREDAEDHTDQDRRLLPVLAGYVVAIVVGLTLPTLAVVIYFAIALYLIVPFGTIMRLVRRHP